MTVQACLNGTRRRAEHDALPLTPEELARDAAAVVEAGAHSLHVHPRGPDGSESLDPDVCDAAVAAIRAAAPGVAAEPLDRPVDHRRRRRAQAGVRARLVGAARLRVAQRRRGGLGGARRAARRARHRDRDRAVGAAASGAAGRERPGRRACLRALVEPQDTAPAVAIATAGAIDGGLERAGIGLPQLHHGNDMTTWAVMDAAVRRGHEVRVGLEDTLALPDARRARDNAELVAAAVERYRRAVDPSRPSG